MESVFIDSDVFLAAFNKRDSNHRRGNELLRKALGRKYGKSCTSDFILDEIISRLIKEVEKGRLRKREIIRLIEESIQNSRMVEFQHVDEPTLGTAKMCFKMYYDKFLSLTDWSSAVLMRNQKTKCIMSFDHHFDTIKGIKEFSFIKRIY